ncbi:hypothetical protein HGM15179_015341 [Zosterops borbonicus]|uniref:Uncharacterized protein n=1 Tax=Zosterops borbonicus TaxID=364589 RepID=A0A8K1G524_9PASS|nr:hypothetical protein HGM15179_015341 [Zosterops borbonicus]
MLHGAGEEWLESCLVKKNLGVFFNVPIDMIQHCAKVAKKANDILACIKIGMASRTWADDIEVLESVQRRAMKLEKGLESKSYQEWLGKLGSFSLEKRRLREDLSTL